MLDYLVTSRTRRALLHLLWVEGRSGSVSALARESGVNFSAVHRELDAMKDAGFARESLDYRRPSRPVSWR
jgi:DNA-binding IclR family transcriptional regulator